MYKEKTVLQALMGLDIGGAETHVIELSIELKKRGYRVIVASNGGDYEDVLKNAGVETVKVPLHTKNPAAVIKSLIILNDLIKKENIKLVHAHARIPAFLLSLLKKKHGFDMITTAHFTFHVNLLLKYLTQWGDRVFVVSDDIRNYLKNIYSIPDGRIYGTINGINLDKFKPTNNLERRGILHVSRLDDDTSLVAEKLIEYGRAHDNILITIVGDGSQLNNLKKQAAGLNNVVFAGRVLNVGEYLDKAQIFVGVSRAALEAMCYNMPVIIAGNFGYMGILDESKLELAEFNNFTARNTNLVTYEDLERDIDFLLKNDQDCRWEREYVKNNYSVEIMVDKYEEVYKLYLGE
ncbi:MAG TPA: glycosyltransferase [Sedimentibacter sp.]|jgi:glycosyltransferase involved in cell wall biosynthesis|nr:glycosyltransferase [Sedimentibacter sp.]HOW22390.1 glycosyltransferase [Sedimentibacter sp.]HRC80408.1 glycosyltransferase [Sedimentibacter sp.]